MKRIIKLLLKNKEINKIIIGIFISILAVYILFFGLFALYGELTKLIYISRFNTGVSNFENKLSKVEDRSEKIFVYNTKLKRINFLEDLKEDLRLILFDTRFFNIENIDDDHLYFMESQRVKHNIPKHIYYRLIFMESGFRMFDNNENVITSSAGAMGYMQILNSTFHNIAQVHNLNIYDVSDPYDNIVAGSFYIKQRKRDIERLFPNMSNRYQWELALAAYNAGLGKVIQSKGIPNYRETINYINFIMRDYSSTLAKK